MPKVDDLGLKILFLLIPGIIGLGVVKSIGPKRPRSDFESGLQIFIYGVVSYAIAGFLEGAYVWYYAPPAGKKSVFEVVGASGLGLATLNADKGLGTGQIAFATAVAIILGGVVAIFQTHSIIHRILGTLALTKRTNEVDIWGFTLNSPNINNWVTVRHHDNGKIYQGWVRAYSDGGDDRELLLADVIVYVASDDGKLVEVDKVPVLYLGLDRTNAVLELSDKSNKLGEAETGTRTDAGTEAEADAKGA